jgi:beta-glucosidase
VRHWSTFNEPYTFAVSFFFVFPLFFFPGSRTAKKTRRRKEKITSFSTPSKKTPPPQFCGHDIGIHAPGRCSDRKTCESGGDSDVEPWVVSHHVLLAHSRAVAAFRALFASAAGRYLDAQLGLYAQPIFGGVSGKGDYPDSLKELVPALPKFTGEEKKALLGSADYFLLNHYTSRWVQDSPGEKPVNAKALTHRPGGASGIAIGPQAASFWLFSVPWG